MPDENSVNAHDVQGGIIGIGGEQIFHGPVSVTLSSVIGKHNALHVLAALRGVGRLLVVLGILLFLAGFGTFGYVVVGFLLVVFGALQSPNPSQPPDIAGVPFVPLLPLGIGLVFLGIVVASCGGILLAWRVTRAAADVLAAQEHQPTPGRTPLALRPEEQRPDNRPQPRHERRLEPDRRVPALFLIILLGLGGLAFVWWSSTRLPAITQPTSAERVFIVANTGGDGVYLRSTPHRVDCRPRPLPAGCVAAYPDGTRLRQIGAGATAEGQTWHQVRAPDGKAGWVPAEYTIEAR